MGYVIMKFYKNQYYQGSLSDEQADILYELSDYDVIPELKHCVANLSSAQIEQVKEAYISGGKIPHFNTAGELSNAQTIGVAFMYHARRCLLGDQVGMGKTVESAGLMNVLRRKFGYKTLFLTEKTIVSQIRDKLIRFTGEYVDRIPSAEAKYIKRFLIDNPDGFKNSVVGSHSLLGCSEFLYYCSKHSIDCLIIDEGYILRNTSHTYYASVKELSKYVKYMVILNATPLETSARDIYNQLKLLDKPFMPTVAEFESAFCIKKPRHFGGGFETVGYKNCGAFREAISLRYLARTRDDIGAEVEGNNVSIVYVPFSNVQKQLESKTSLHQMVSDFPTGVDFTVAYNTETTGKLKALLELIKIRNLTHERILIYSRFVECQSGMRSALESIGCKIAVLNGKCSSKQRDEIIRDFNMGAVNIIVTNITRGIDLEDCDNCIFYSIDPNPQKMVQAFGRLTRDEDIINKNIYFLVSEGTEKKNFKGSLKVRAQASMQFTKVGTNLVLEAIANDEQW